MDLYDEFFAIIPALNDAGISYAVVGGIALAFHKHPRFTRDIDIACAVADIEKVEATLRELGSLRNRSHQDASGRR